MHMIGMDDDFANIRKILILRQLSSKYVVVLSVKTVSDYKFIHSTYSSVIKSLLHPTASEEQN